MSPEKLWELLEPFLPEGWFAPNQVKGSSVKLGMRERLEELCKAGYLEGHRAQSGFYFRRKR